MNRIGKPFCAPGPPSAKRRMRRPILEIEIAPSFSNRKKQARRLFHSALVFLAFPIKTNLRRTQTPDPANANMAMNKITYKTTSAITPISAPFPQDFAFSG